MLNYEGIIDIVTEINSNDLIPKDGLILTYELEERYHKKLHEDVYYKKGGQIGGFEHDNIFEIYSKTEDDIVWVIRFVVKENE